MELEYFISDSDEAWGPALAEWTERSWSFLTSLGLREDLMALDEHEGTKLAHYARACTDIVFTFPFGTQELMGIAARGNFDLTQHATHSGEKMEYFDEAAKVCIVTTVTIVAFLTAVTAIATFAFCLSLSLPLAPHSNTLITLQYTRPPAALHPTRRRAVVWGRPPLPRTPHICVHGG
jgi:hypothetical protein